MAPRSPLGVALLGVCGLVGVGMALLAEVTRRWALRPQKLKLFASCCLPI